MAFGYRPIYQPELLLLCSHSPNDVPPPKPQRNVSIAAVPRYGTPCVRPTTRTDNGLGLIKRAINKMSYHNLFIMHSNPLFTEFYLKETTDFLSTEVMLEDV